MFHIELNADQLDFLIELLSHTVDHYEGDAAALLRIAPQRPAAQDLALERLDASQTAAELLDLLKDL